MNILLILLVVWIAFAVLGAVLHAIRWLIGAAIVVTIVVLAIRSGRRGRA